jgi:cation diffusion facilitator family transporter
MDLQERGARIAAITAIFLISAGVLQVILGQTISKSVALTANGIDCIGDGFVSSIVYIGFRYIRRPADHKFHFGYYKFESVASVAAATVMVVLAIYIIWRSYLQLIDPHEVENVEVGASIAYIAAAGALALGVFKYRNAKAMQLGSARLEAFNTVKDGTASFLAGTALVLSSMGYPIADAIAGFIISIILLFVGFTAMKEAGYILVDACDYECIDHTAVIQNLLIEYKDIRGTKISLRRTGPVLMGEIIIEVDGGMTIELMDRLREEVSTDIVREVPNLERLTISAVPFVEKRSEDTE